MCKAVQHFRIFAKSLDCQTVVFLIQEKSGFLTILHIYQIMYSVFHDLHFRLLRLADPSFHFRKPLFFPLIGIASLEDTADDHAILRKYLF